MSSAFYRANLSEIDDVIIQSTLDTIRLHQQRYNVGIPYKWAQGGWTVLDDKQACVSNMTHQTTPEYLQQHQPIYFENVMLPYVYPHIDKWVETYKPEFKDVPFHTKSSWYMIYGTNKDTYTPKHDHSGQGARTNGGNDIECCSGCFYLQSPGNSTRTFEYYKDNNDPVVIEPKSRDLILFPSNMPHSAYQKRTNQESIAIAFNVLFYDKGNNSGIDSQK